MITQIILSGIWTAGDARAVVFALGYSVGVGGPHGVVLGTAAALLLYGIRGPAARGAGSGAVNE